MTSQHNTLIPALVAPLAIAAAAVVTNAAAHKTYIRGYSLHNTGNTVQTVYLYLVQNVAGNAGAAATANEVAVHVLGPYATLDREVPGPIGWALEGTNDTLQAKSTTASVVNLTAEGEVMT